MSKRKSIVDYSQKVLEVKNLKKYFRVGVGRNKLIVPAVDDVTFDVYKREVFGLVGESGSGKTTTGRTIIKLYEATEGTVKLNDVTIANGYANHIENIKKIKKQRKLDVKKLDPRHAQIIKLEEKLDQDIALINYDLAHLPELQKEELTQANEPIFEHRKKLYELKTQFKLDAEAVIFQYKLDKRDIHLKAQNKAKIELKHELDILKTNYERKVDGLKDSAALSKEEIKKRLAELKSTYEQDVAALNNKYQSEVESSEAEVISKKDAKQQLKALKSETSKQLADIKAQYLKARNEIKRPDLETVKAKRAEIHNKYKEKRAGLNAKIKSLKEAFNAEVKAIPKHMPSVDEKLAMKEKAKLIDLKAKEDIKLEKSKIEAAKRINRSKDTLVASRKMQMIFQDPISSLNPRMTVREIIAEGLIIQGQTPEDEISKLVDEVLEIVGLAPEYATRYPHEFSGGQRQRIGIARALIMNPNFIIADEPISALDVSIRAQVLNLLTNLKEKLGLTMLFIAHDLSVVRFFCDRIAVMYNGKIVELASSEELFNNPMHPYTISLLSAIPQPDPDYEKGRKRIHYNPRQEHDYRMDKPSLREIADGHMVYANDKEFEAMKKTYAKNNPKSKA